VSELDFLLNRKKSVGKTSDSRVEKEEEIGLESRENRGEALPQTTESSGKSVEERGKPEESSGLTLESLGKSVEGTPEVEMETLEERGNPLQSGVSRQEKYRVCNDDPPLQRAQDRSLELSLLLGPPVSL